MDHIPEFICAVDAEGHHEIFRELFPVEANEGTVRHILNKYKED
jgi:hypothetical protein